ncbi:MAG: hypothetical protein AAGK78_01895 [Planctomycetota bacterium]
MRGKLRLPRGRVEWLAVGLLVLGLAQMAGDLVLLATVSPSLKGIAAATGASPAPKVFCSQGGLETFSSRFALVYTDATGVEVELPLTPETYGMMAGPYKRRNVYGAALSYGPVLPDELRRPVFRFGLTNDAPLLRELGITGATDARLRYTHIDGTSADFATEMMP